MSKRAARSDGLVRRGEPGLVLAALHDAQVAVHSVGKRDGKGMTYQDADEIVVVGKRALADAGLVYCMSLSPLEVTDTGDQTAKQKRIFQVTVDATMAIIHPKDGSRLSFSATGSTLVNGLGKYGSACCTAARKQVWQCALGITSGESDQAHEEPTPEYEVPEWVEFMVAEIQDCETSKELRAFVETEKYANAKGEDRAYMKSFAMSHLARLRERLPESIEFLVAQLEACQSRAELREVTATEEYKAVRGYHRSVLANVGRARVDILVRLGERDGNKSSIEPAEFNKRPKREKKKVPEQPRHPDSRGPDFDGYAGEMSSVYQGLETCELRVLPRWVKKAQEIRRRYDMGVDDRFEEILKSRERQTQ